MRNNKKIVLFIVEGNSDREALELPFASLYDYLGLNYEVRFAKYDPAHSLTNPKSGDITSDDRISPKNIVDRIKTDIINPFLLNLNVSERCNFLDLAEIIQIVDLDGVYIDDSRIVFDSTKDKAFYCEDTILTNKVEDIIDRNKRKRENLNYLLSLTEISMNKHPVPYSLYYFSSNLDHFFSDDPNIPCDRKIDLPREFAKHYCDYPDEFAKYYSTNKRCRINMGYMESWDWPKHGERSLEKGSNLNILINRIVTSSS